MRNVQRLLFLLIFFSGQLTAQTVEVSGYVFGSGNQGPLEGVQIQVRNTANQLLVAETISDRNGAFRVDLLTNNSYLLEGNRPDFYKQASILILNADQVGQKAVANLRLTPRLEGDYPSTGRPVNTSLTLAEQQAVAEYNIDVKSIRTNANPDGVELGTLVASTDPIVEVTNATRLVDKSYSRTERRADQLRQPMPFAYESTQEVLAYEPNRQPAATTMQPRGYDTPTAIPNTTVPPPALGESVVAVASAQPPVRPVPGQYTGYKIELLTSMGVLAADHPIFRKHGGVQEELRPNGAYSYLVGHFDDSLMAEEFLKNNLLATYPGATVVFFENGQRSTGRPFPPSNGKKQLQPPR